MSTVLTADQSKLVSILNANDFRVTRDVAEDLVDQIALVCLLNNRLTLGECCQLA